MNKIFTFYIVLLCVTTSSWTQVSIGSDIKPLAGTILELKQFSPTVAGGANSTKGLLLPRVKLSEINSLIDINGVDASEHIGHTGLMVYNMTTDFCKPLSPGVYVWAGVEWYRMGSNVAIAVNELVDNRAGDVKQVYKTGHFVAIDPATSEVVADAGEWMLENLRAKTYDSAIPMEQRQSLLLHNGDNTFNTNLAYYSYPNRDQSRVATEGYYYSGVAALNNQVVDGISGGTNVPSRIQQGICPDGWRIPTYEDWKLLESVMINSHCEFSFPLSAKDKELGGLIRTGQSIDFTSKLASEGGFDAYAEGTYNIDGSFNSVMGKYPSFITTYPIPVSMEDGGTKYPMYGMFSFSESESYSQFHTSPSQNMPVRCVKGNNAPVQVIYTGYSFLPNN